MTLSNKFGIPSGLLESTKQVLSESGEYQAKVKAHMAKKGIKSLNDLTNDQKKNFFNELDAMHKAKNEEVEQVEEELKGEMHPDAHKVLKHIKPEHHSTYKPFLKKGTYKGDYKDRAAVLSAAEKAGHIKEDTELNQEDLDFIASLNQIDEISIKTAVKAHERMALETNPEKGRTGLAGDQSDRLLKKMKAKWGDKAVKKAQIKYQGTNEDFSLDEFSVEEIEEFMQTEDFTQLDELSKDTLKSYLKKSKDRSMEFQKKGDSTYSSKKASPFYDKRDKVNSARRGARDRLKGVFHPKEAPYGTKNEDFDLDDFTLEQIQEFMQTEDFSQLDELSKETLGNYIKKRQHDVATQGAITRHHSEKSHRERDAENYVDARKSNEKADKAFAKGWKHRQNISKAVDKIVKKA